MKKNYIILIISCSTLTIIAQNTWTQKTDAAGGYAPRGQAIGFSIGTKGYYGTGCVGNGVPFFHEYDSSTDTWTPKANFNDNRYEAAAFSIGTKGYVGTGEGAGGSVIVKTFFEYNPSTDTWTQKADFGGTARYAAVGFSIGTKGYIGTGKDINSVNTKDFWEYNPSTNLWTQKANFGGAGRADAVGFSIGNKGYIGTGVGSTYYQDFWEYDQSTDTWMQKANYGGSIVSEAVGFSIGNYGFVGTGYPSNVNFWRWNQSLNTWTQEANFIGTPVRNAIGFSIGNKGYIGSGDDGSGTSGTLYSAFYEYDSGLNVGIKDITNTQSPIFNVSPNPITSQAIITFSDEVNNAIIKVTDVLGKEIKVITFSGKQLLFEKGDLKEGIYFLQLIIDDAKNTITKKIVIQ